MPYEFYKLAHYLGLAMSLCGVGAIWAFSTRQSRSSSDKRPGWMAAIHGTGLLLLLVAGFGLLARIGEHSFPLWVWIKIVFWLFLGAVPVLFRRKPDLSFLWGGLTVLFVFLAAASSIHNF